eukprot:GHVU01078295.1.p2 GENE.GHVU01078295.1~~GHVU01078295.1.p2  ORF type:complete len:117 (-),score=7.89 GHVU01078295.1:514-864(-)
MMTMRCIIAVSQRTRQEREGSIPPQQAQRCPFSEARSIDRRLAREVTFCLFKTSKHYSGTTTGGGGGGGGEVGGEKGEGGSRSLEEGSGVDGLPWRACPSPGRHATPFTYIPSVWL